MVKSSPGLSELGENLARFEQIWRRPVQAACRKLLSCGKLYSHSNGFPRPNKMAFLSFSARVFARSLRLCVAGLLRLADET
jgi:hypothetical protein